MSAPASPRPLWLLVVLMMSVLLDTMSFSMAIPLMPFYSLHFGASDFQVSLLFATFPALQIVATPIWGSLGDRLGYRLTLLSSIAGTGLSYLAFGLANGLGWLFLGRALAGATGSTIAVARAYVATVTEPAHRPQRFAFLQAALATGLMIGPLLTSLCVGRDFQNPNFRLPGLVAAGLAIGALTVAWVVLPRDHIPHNHLPRVRSLPTPRSHPSLSSFLRDSPRSIVHLSRDTLLRPLRSLVTVTAQIHHNAHLRDLMGAIFVNFSIGFGFLAIFPLWCAQELGWDIHSYSTLFTAAALSCAILLVTLPRLTRTIAPAALLPPGFLMMALALGGMAVVPALPQAHQVLGICSVGLLFAVGTMLVTPNVYSLVSQTAEARHQGSTLGVAESVTNLGSAVGAAGLGLLLDRGGAIAPCILGSAVLVGLALTCHWRIRST